MTITYELGNSLYVNLTNRCSNDCTFCVRNEHKDVNGKDNLWLSKEPEISEIKADLEKRDLKKYDGVVFCGFGEPMMRYDAVIAVASWLKKTYPFVKIRINTNGQGNLIAKKDITPEFNGIIDCISISLNSDNKKDYQEICKSIYGEEAFDALLEFAALSKKYVPDVILSVVDVVTPKAVIENCRSIAKRLGVSFRVREFID